MWTEFITATSHYQVLYSTSTDKGATWAAPTVVYDTNNLVMTGPALAEDNDGNIHVSVTVSDGVGGYDLYYFQKPFGGAWSGGTLIRDGSALGGIVQYASICVDGDDNIWIAWVLRIGAIGRVRATKSSDGGASWGADEMVSGGVNSANFPNIIVDDNEVPHAAWIETIATKSQPMYNNRIGGAWNVPVQLDADANYNADAASIAISATGDVWVATCKRRALDAAAQVYYYRYTGGAWGGATLVSDDSANACGYVSLGADGAGRVYFVWQQSGVLTDVYERTWNGAGLDAQITLSNGAAGFGGWRTSQAHTSWPNWSNPEIGFAAAFGCLGASRLDYYGPDDLKWPSGGHHPCLHRPLKERALQGHVPGGQFY